MEEQKQLVANDFFPRTIKVNLSEIFPVAVVATMSSGKSTLINALIGKEILPYGNAACTSRAISILDDDNPSKEIICTTDCNGRTKLIDQNLKEELKRLNSNPDIQNIFIRSHIQNIFNTNKALLLIDTPGPNNSQDNAQRRELTNLLNKLYGGLILYVLNTANLGVGDDKKLLEFIQNYLHQRSELRIVFILNKIDVLDKEKESITKSVLEAKQYIEKCGFSNPTIVPVSSRAAVLFNKVLRSENLTRKEHSDFEELYELFEPHDFNMERFSITEELPWQFEEINAYGTRYTVGELNQAKCNTGIKLIESLIQKAQIRNDKKPQNMIKAKLTK